MTSWARTTNLAGEGGDRLFAIGLTLAFVVTSALVAAHHEPWRDEVQAWLLARDSQSLPDLFRHLKYEGHPGLWHTLLFAAQRVFGSDPAVLQAVHIAVAATTVGLVARFAPFSRTQRALFAFGYFPFYEYSAISRNYALGLLLLVAACILIPVRRERWVLLGATIFLLAHTSALALITAAALTTALALSHVTGRGTPSPKLLSTADRGLRLGFILMLAGIATAAVQLAPPADSGFATRWHVGFDAARIARVAYAIPGAVFPIPVAQLNYWNVLLFEQSDWLKRGALALTLGFAAWAVHAVARRRLALWFFLLATGGLLAFFYAKYVGFLNHHGWLFAASIAALWVRYAEPDPAQLEDSGSNEQRRKVPGIIFTALLTVHVVAGVMAAGLDWKYPFSQGRNAGRFLVANGLGHALLIGDPDFTTATVLAYLPGTPAYFPRGDRFGTFTVWDRRRLVPIFDRDVMDRAERARSVRGTDVIIVLNHALDPALAADTRVRELAAFVGSAVGDEDVFLYLLPNSAAPHP